MMIKKRNSIKKKKKKLKKKILQYVFYTRLLYNKFDY